MTLLSLIQRRLVLPLWQWMIFLTTFLLLINLGFWQLHRAEEKRELLTAFTRQAAPFTLDTVKTSPRRYNFVTLQMLGHWHMGRSFLLDNQFHQHQIGYHVITPVTVAGDEKWILVDRGFINKQENHNPKILTEKPDGAELIIGRLYAPSQQVLLLGKIENNPGQTPMVLERIDFDKVGKLLGHPVHPFILWLDPSANDGFVREWTPVIILPERHYAYAAQWFGLAFVLLCVNVALYRKQSNSSGAS